MFATTPDTRRTHIKYLFGTAILLWSLVGIGQFMSTSNTDQHARMGEPLIPQFVQLQPSLTAIDLVSADMRYSLERQGDVWRMPEANNYPVRADRMAELLSGLETISYGRARTINPEKHDLIGLGDPSTGGTGMEVTLRGQSGTPLAVFIIGRRNDRLYARQSDRDETFRLSGSLPPFYNRDTWLDFNIVDITPTTIRSVRLRDSAARGLYLTRAPGQDGRAFVPAPPYGSDTIINRLGISATGLALSRFDPRDAKPASRLQTASIGEHITETFDGLEIVVNAYRENDGLWVTLRAIEAGEGARRAQAINGKANNWAFRLSPFDFEDYVPSVLSLVNRSEDQIAQP